MKLAAVQERIKQALDIRTTYMNGHEVVKVNPRKRGSHMTGYSKEYDYHCKECGVTKEVKGLFSEFECGGDPDTSVETSLTVETVEEVDSHRKEYWFKVVEGPRSGLQHGMRVAEEIDIEVGSYYEITARSLNDKRTAWKVTSATEID